MMGATHTLQQLLMGARWVADDGRHVMRGAIPFILAERRPRVADPSVEE